MPLIITLPRTVALFLITDVTRRGPLCIYIYLKICGMLNTMPQCDGCYFNYFGAVALIIPRLHKKNV